MKQALALAFAFALSVAGTAMAQDKASTATAPQVGEAKGMVRWVEVGQQAIVLEDGTRLSVSDKQIDNIWSGDQVKAGYVVTPDGKFTISGIQVDRFSNQEAD